MRGIDEMGAQDGVHVGVGELDLFVVLDHRQVFGGGFAANHAVRLVGDGGLVDDCIVDLGRDALILAPLLGEDVVDVDLHLVVIQVFHGGLPEEVLCAFALQQDVEAAVRRTDS